MGDLRYQQIQAPKYNTDYMKDAGNLFQQATSGLGDVLTKVADEKRASASNSFDAQIMNTKDAAGVEALKQSYLNKELPGSDYLNPQKVMQGFEDRNKEFRDRDQLNLKQAFEKSNRAFTTQQQENTTNDYNAGKELREKKLELQGINAQYDIDTSQEDQTQKDVVRETALAVAENTFKNIARTTRGRDMLDKFNKSSISEIKDPKFINKFIKDNKVTTETAQALRANAKTRIEYFTVQDNAIKQEQANAMLTKYANGDYENDDAALKDLTTVLGSEKAISRMFALRNSLGVLGSINATKDRAAQELKEKGINSRMQGVRDNIDIMTDIPAKQNATAALGRLDYILKFEKDKGILEEVAKIGGVDELTSLLLDATRSGSGMFPWSDPRQYKGNPKLTNLLKVLGEYKRDTGSDSDDDDNDEDNPKKPLVIPKNLPGAPNLGQVDTNKLIANLEKKAPQKKQPVALQESTVKLFGKEYKISNKVNPKSDAVTPEQKLVKKLKGSLTSKEGKTLNEMLRSN